MRETSSAVAVDVAQVRADETGARGKTRVDALFSRRRRYRGVRGPLFRVLHRVRDERVCEISVQHVLRAQRAERRGFGDMDRGRARRRVA